MSSKSKDQFGSSQFSQDKVSELKNVLGGQNQAEDSLAGEEMTEVEQSSPNEDDSVIKQLEEKLEQAETAAKSHHEKLVRTIADFENAKKRMDREKTESIKFANEKLLTEFMTVYDHLEMTLQHAQPSDQKDPIAEGVKLVIKQFIATLEKFGVEVVEGLGQNFDPHSQEAIGSVESTDYQAGQVAQVHRKGFKLNGRLVRAAMVSIVKEPES